MALSDILPADQLEVVTRALHHALDLTGPESITPVTGGHTASLVYRVVARDTPYLMKIITRNEDPSRHYASMRAAASAGLAPRVLYTDSTARISITDFVSAQPLSRTDALNLLPDHLRRLHALPPFDPAPFNTTCTFFFSPGEILPGFLKRFQSAQTLPPADLEEFNLRLAEIIAAYPAGTEAVASHNDLFKPDNILWDGRQIWLVDWEAAFVNDRYADLAVVANQLVTTPEDEAAYLTAYFGGTPTEYQAARFHVMQQLSHLFYTMGMLTLGAAGRPVDWSGTLPAWPDFQKTWWSGGVNVSKPDDKLLYGKVNWLRLKENVRQPRYAKALRLLSSRK